MQVIPFNGWTMSHVAWHVENADEVSHRLSERGFVVAQEVRTVKHTNPYLLERNRTYRYVIHEGRGQLGFDLKLIQRIES
jgi:hypothetical protein